MLMAGTVNRVGTSSPRPRARYSLSIAADPQPTACEALQMTQRVASRSSSSPKTAAQASSSISWRRRVSSRTSRPRAVTSVRPSSLVRRSATVEIDMLTILAKARYEREREQGGDDEAEPGDEQVPVGRRSFIGHATGAEAGRGRQQDDPRPGEVCEGQPAQRLARAALRRAASSASRCVIRRYSTYRYTQAAAPRPAT